jgi:hypothetical protein
MKKYVPDLESTSKPARNPFDSGSKYLSSSMKNRILEQPINYIEEIEGNVKTNKARAR